MLPGPPGQAERGLAMAVGKSPAARLGSSIVVVVIRRSLNSAAGSWYSTCRTGEVDCSAAPFGSPFTSGVFRGVLPGKSCRVWSLRTTAPSRVVKRQIRLISLVSPPASSQGM
ncbi:MAG TPA: hypothetical protein VGX76_23560 [Pirellulales bacterium]|jgi:hypothetical protein|nr:hypothetical protein [Pirellulales bacterium]